jgi:MFS family permease
MEPESGSRSGFTLRGSAGLIVAIAVVAILLIALPAYRWFFLISLLIGLVIAGGLTLWHKLHPIEEQDVEPKRPLGL